MSAVSISSLKVVQLKAELEKRGLEKSGIKSVLIDRLSEALIKEGLDPENYETQMHEIDGSEGDKDQKNTSDDEERMQETSSLMDHEVMPPPSSLVLTVEDSIAIKKAFHPSASSGNLSVADSMKVNVDDKEVAEMTQELTSELNAASSNSPVNANESNVDNVNEDQLQQNANKTTTNPQNGQKRKNMAKKTGKGTDAKLLWVANIGTEIKAADLKDHFAECGKVIVSRIVTMKSSSSIQDTLYGHLEMGSASDVISAIRMFDGAELKGRKLCVGSTLATVKKKMEKSSTEIQAVKEVPVVVSEKAEKLPEDEKESPVKGNITEREEQLQAEEKRLKELRRDIFLQKLEIQKVSASLQYQLKRASTVSQIPRRGGLSLRRGSGVFIRPALGVRKPHVPSETVEPDTIEAPSSQPIRFNSRRIPSSVPSRYPLSLRGRGAFRRPYMSSILQRGSRIIQKRPASSAYFHPSKFARLSNENEGQPSRHPTHAVRDDFPDQRHSFKKPYPERVSRRFSTSAHENREMRFPPNESSYHENKTPRHSIESSRSRYSHTEPMDVKFPYENKRRSFPEVPSRKFSRGSEHKPAFYTKSDRPGEYLAAQSQRERRSGYETNFERRYPSSGHRESRDKVEIVRTSFHDASKHKNDERNKWPYRSTRSDFPSSSPKGSYYPQYEERSHPKVTTSRVRRGDFEGYSRGHAPSRKHFYTTSKRY